MNIGISRISTPKPIILELDPGEFQRLLNACSIAQDEYSDQAFHATEPAATVYRKKRELLLESVREMEAFLDAHPIELKIT